MRGPYSYLDSTPGFGTRRSSYGGADGTYYNYGSVEPTRAATARRDQRLNRREWRRYERARRQGRYYPYPAEYADAGDLRDDLHAQAMAEIAGPDAAREYLAEKAARESAGGAGAGTIVAIGLALWALSGGI
jgi:hypothetical protein